MKLSEIELNRLTHRLKYRFSNLSLLEQALTHRSAAKQHNERLEFLGDSVLGIIISDALFQRFTNINEGELSRMRAFLVCGEMLAELAQEMELGQFVRLGPGEMKSGGHLRESILADMVEALMGAIYLDSDLETCRRVVLQWFKEKLAGVVPGEVDKDAKTQLQEMLQAEQIPVPEYQIIEATGLAHNQKFKVACSIAVLSEPTIGEGTSRKKAEQAAAKQALKLIQRQKEVK